MQRVKEQIDLLPEYLRFESLMDDETEKVTKAIKNATTLKNPVTKTKIMVRAGAASLGKAVSLARGLTAPIIHYDEVEFTDFIDTIVDNSVNTFETAARASKHNGSMYCRVFTSTPGDLDSNAGKGAQLIIDRCVNWNEVLYDMTTKEMEEFASVGNSNSIVYIEFMYYQIGLDKEWLKNIRKKYTSDLVFKREVLLQRLHGSSLSPYKQEDMDEIAEMVHKPIKILFIRDYYQFKVYEEWDLSIPYIVGVDCSTGTNNDYNAITIVDPYTEKVVGEFECDFIGEPEYERVIIELIRRFLPRAIVVIERNSVGDGILAHLLESPIANRLYFDRAKDLLTDNVKQYETVESILKKRASEKSFYGVYTDGTSREDMFGILATRIKDHKSKFIGENLTRDLMRLIRKTSGRIEAGPGFHDDSVMSYLMAMYVLLQGNNLPLFGYIPGEKKDTPKNQGLNYETKAELESVLPPDIAEAMVKNKKEVEEVMNYQNILKEAIAKAQAETAKELRSTSVKYETNIDPHEVVADEEDFGVNIPMSFFEEMNGMNTSDAGLFGSDSIWK